MSTHINLKNQFLLAMPQLTDPWFGGSLCYICEHNENGAMGLIINKPLDLKLGDIYLEFGMKSQHFDKYPVFQGGPVSPEQGFILYRDHIFEGQSLNISEDTFLTTSKDMLTVLANGTGPDELIVCLGYAGWDAGQLEEEIAKNSWLTIPADQTILFHTSPQEQTKLAASKLGITLSQLSGDSGHA